MRPGYSLLGLSTLAVLVAASVVISAQRRAAAGDDGVARTVPYGQTVAQPFDPVNSLSGLIRFRSGWTRFEARPPKQTAHTLQSIRATGERHFVIQFHRPVTGVQRSDLAAAGVKLLHYLGNHAFFAGLNEHPLDPIAAANVGDFYMAEPIDPNWKLHPDLAAGVAYEWMVVSGPRVRARAVVPRAFQNPRVAVYVLFHRDVTLAGEARRILRTHGVRIRSLLRTVNGAVIELPYMRIAALAAEDAVMWIEPPLPKFIELNDGVRQAVGADVVQAPPDALSGAGVSVLVYDGGPAAAGHPDFGGRLFVRERDCVVSLHASHVSGTLGGSGDASGGLLRGMAPGVVMQSYGFETDPNGNTDPNATFLYTDPGDIERDYGQAINVYAAAIANNSIGTNTASNGFPCEWEGDYGVTDAVIDAIARGGVSGRPFPIVWAAGNERGSGRCGNEYFTSAPPANAKNHITVGALNSDDESVTSFTSWGASDDGRMRPDLVAPGCEVGGDGGVTSCDTGSGYYVACGTSMASPTVCGLGALLIEDFRRQYPNRPDPGGATLKAILANTATDVESIGPDYRTGMGAVRIEPAVGLLRAGDFYEGAVDQGGTIAIDVIVDPNAARLRVTLAWDDPPAAPVVDPTLVNDLDLTVFDPNNNAHYPWTLDPADPSAPAVRTQPNRRDNLEQLLIDNPAPGVYRIEVSGFDVPTGPQSFSIAASSHVVACSETGVVSLDRDAYSCSGPLVVQVVDCGPNNDYGVVEAIAVQVESSSELIGETVALTETTAASGTFRGTIDLSPIDAEGFLLVGPGDTITARYIDADDGQGNNNVTVTDAAAVDCAAPQISSVQVVELLPRGATISIVTDEPARSRVRYGTSCGAPGDEISGLTAVTNHAIALNGLTAETGYYFQIEVVDEAGNVTIDDNAGACYTFTTPDAIYVPDDFASIQQAICTARGGELILVRPGTYAENIDFAGKAVTVRSAQGPLVTIIDGSRSGSVVTFANSEGADSVLDGFTLRNGSGTDFLWFVFWIKAGGGVFCYGYASPTIVNNIIADNTAEFGGGIWCFGLTSPVIRGNRIAANTAERHGGGVYILLSNHIASLEDNIIEDNQAELGGGVYAANGTMIVSGNTFARNVARNLGSLDSTAGWGGGMHLKARGDLPSVITNNRFVDNMALSIANPNDPNIPAGIGWGGGLAIDSVGLWPQVVNNLFTGNSASYGGAVHGHRSNAVFANNTISGNTAEMKCGGIYWGADSDLVLTNSIIRKNPAPIIQNLFKEADSTVTVEYSNIGGGWPGVGNINVDPLFVDPESDDFRLGPTSPCIDAGDSAAVPPDAADIDGDEDTTERTPLDLERFLRFVDDAAADTGIADPPDYPHVVDMGAYEAGDCNRNGLSDVCDLDCGAPGGPCDLPGCGQSFDCNGNGVPDECEESSDCNGNGIPDLLDVATGTSPDCNGNCVPDECDVVPPPFEPGIGYWSFEEGGGSTIAEFDPNSGLNGTTNGLPVRTADVPVSPVPQSGLPNTQSLDLNWQNIGGGGFFDVPDAGGALSFGNADFTIEAWVRLEHISNSGGPDERQWLCIKKPLPSADDQMDYGVLAQAGSLGVTGRELAVQYGTGAATGGVISSLEIDDLDWHFVNVAYDEAAGTVHFGVDQQFETVAMNKPNHVNNGPLRVGAHQNAAGADNQFLRGALDELRISGSVISEMALLSRLRTAYSADDDGNGVPDECESACPGDLDADRDVDLTDLALLLSDFDCTGGGCVGDVNGNGATDLTDLATLLAEFGTSCP